VLVDVLIKKSTEGSHTTGGVRRGKEKHDIKLGAKVYIGGGKTSIEMVWAQTGNDNPPGTEEN